MKDVSANLSLTLLANLCKLCTSCCFFQFTGFKNVFNVLKQRSSIGCKKFFQLVLSQPKCFCLQTNLCLNSAVWSSINDYFARILHIQGFRVFGFKI